MSNLRVHSSRSGPLLASEEFLHSVRIGKNGLTKGVWDLIAAAPLLQERDACSEILLLGVGGGTVLHQWDRMLTNWRWTGIEFDAGSIESLHEDFGLPETPGEIYQTDAYDFLRASDRRFHVVIDDLFAEVGGRHVRPTFDKPDWLRCIQRRLRRGGMLVTNLVWNDDREGDNQSYYEALRDAFDHVALLTRRSVANRVVAASQRPLNTRALPHRFRGALGRNTAYRDIRCRTVSIL